MRERRTLLTYLPAQCNTRHGSEKIEKHRTQWKNSLKGYLVMQIHTYTQKNEFSVLQTLRYREDAPSGTKRVEGNRSSRGPPSRSLSSHLCSSRAYVSWFICKRVVGAQSVIRHILSTGRSRIHRRIVCTWTLTSGWQVDHSNLALLQRCPALGPSFLLRSARKMPAA